ncbi:MAG: hypothetical protein QF493_13570 [Rhodospirillales bacterium]|nr:hypothetical protein [Rhodospirillales bacterium]
MISKLPLMGVLRTARPNTSAVVRIIIENMMIETNAVRTRRVQNAIGPAPPRSAGSN